MNTAMMDTSFKFNFPALFVVLPLLLIAYSMSPMYCLYLIIILMGMYICYQKFNTQNIMVLEHKNDEDDSDDDDDDAYSDSDDSDEDDESGAKKMTADNTDDNTNEHESKTQS